MQSMVSKKELFTRKIMTLMTHYEIRESKIIKQNKMVDEKWDGLSLAIIIHTTSISFLRTPVLPSNS